MAEAAMVARTFRIEPAGLLRDGGDDWSMLVNLAAARYVARQEKAEQEQSERSHKSGKSGGGGKANYRRPSGAGRRSSRGRRR